MPKSQIMFTVPSDPIKVAEILSEAGAEVDGVDDCDFDTVLDTLKTSIGETMDATFDDDDPLTPIWNMADALDGSGCPYWAASDAFVERSRGIRVLGRILLNRDGGPERQDINVPWEFGEPKLDVRTLMAAGLGKEEATAVNDAFLSENRAPPRP